MKKRTLVSTLVAALLLMAAASAHALTKYESTITTITPSNPLILDAANPDSSYVTLSFASAAGPLTSAILNLDISSLKNATITLGRKGKGSAVLPPQGTVMTDATGTFLHDITFTGNGVKTINLKDYLSVLNTANTKDGLDLGLQINRGAVGLSGAKLSGTMAPEPISMALMGAGLAGLPFARRLRNSLKG